MLPLLMLEEPNSQKCIIDGVKNISYCEHIELFCNPNYFRYAQLYYCSKFYPSTTLTILISTGLVILIGILTKILSTIISNYLVFCVVNFSEMIGSNNNTLGLIILPLTNSLPDLINFYTAMKSDSTDLVLGQIVGASLINFTLIIGLICWLYPFRTDNRTRDYTTFLWDLGVFSFLIIILEDGKVTMKECIGLTIFFICYMVWSHKEDVAQEDDLSAIENAIADTTIFPISLSTNLLEQGNDNIMDSASLKSVVEQEEKFDVWEVINILFDHAIFLFIPISETIIVSNHMSYIKRLIHRTFLFRFWLTGVTTSLIYFWFNGTITLWIAPLLFFAFCFEEVLRCSCSGTVICLILDVICVLNSFLIISNLTKIALQILKNLAIIWNVSEYSMGLFVFSVVNSINDIVMNVLMSQNVQPSLGVKSSLGTCILIFSIGIGFNGILCMLQNNRDGVPLLERSLKFTLDHEIYASATMLMVMLGIYLIYIPANNWRFDRRIGAFAMVFWFITNGLCLVIEMKSKTS